MEEYVNHGKKWKDDEVKSLLGEIGSKSMDEISEIHKRTIGGIHSKLIGLAAIDIKENQTTKKEIMKKYKLDDDGYAKAYGRSIQTVKEKKPTDKKISGTKAMLDKIVDLSDRIQIIENKLNIPSNKKKDDSTDKFSEMIKNALQLDKSEIYSDSESDDVKDDKSNDAEDDTNYETLEKLIGKKVLVFDIETTGIPSKKAKYTVGKDEYYDPKKLDKYDSSRIVSIAFCYFDDFQFNKLKKAKVKNYIRMPVDFKSIPDSAVAIHGITYKYAKENGLKLGKIINDNLFESLSECQYIVGHNVLFDTYILLSELWRIEFVDSYNDLYKLLENDKYVCTGELGRNICKLPTKQTEVQYKMPRLNELYEKLCGKADLRFHDSGEDVKAVLQILDKMYDK